MRKSAALWLKLKELFDLTGAPIFIASLCCLAPIILVLFGFSSVAFAVSLTNVLDGRYRWAFILAGLVLLAASLLSYFRKKGICTLDQAKKHRNEIINKVLLALIASVIGYVIFFIVFLGYIGRLLNIWQ